MQWWSLWQEFAASSTVTAVSKPSNAKPLDAQVVRVVPTIGLSLL